MRKKQPETVMTYEQWERRFKKALKRTIKQKVNRVLMYLVMFFLITMPVWMFIDYVQATESLVVTSIKTFKTADCILEQCTGIKDKNGNLIYEGDIVELTRQRRWIRKGKRLAIKWRTFSCCGFCLEDRGVLTEKCAKECIVIGNIHENKEFRK